MAGLSLTQGSYFVIVPSTKQDLEQLKWVLTNLKFFPTSNSTPPLPIAYDSSFDYRELCKFVGLSGIYPVVKTRDFITLAQFGTDIIPFADWITQYKLEFTPTVAVADDYESNTKGSRPSNEIFLTYHY